MKLFGFNIGRRTKSAPTKPLTPESWLDEDLEDAPQGAVLANAYEQVVWVYRAVNVLAEAVANVPFVFSAGPRGRENLITSGPLHEFYQRPHPHLNRFQYWELRVLWLMLRGECFRIPIYHDSAPTLAHQMGEGSRVRAPHSPAHSFTNSSVHPVSSNQHPVSAVPHQLSTTSPRQSPSRSGATAGPPLSTINSRLKSVLILDPAHFQHLVEDHELVGWRYTGFGPDTPLEAQIFLPEEVWFERLPNPFNFWRGLSPLSVAAMAARTDFMAGAFMQGLVENNADMGVIVRTKEPMGREQREQILAALRQRKRKAGTADRPVVVWGSHDIIVPQLSSADLQFLDNRKFSRAEICAAFGVPEEIVTTTEHAKYDVMAGARLNFIENRVAPLCSRLEAEEARTVSVIDPQATGWFDLDSLPILQQARRSRLAAAKAGFELGIPFNELNRVLDLGFKPLAWGDRGFLPASLQEIAAEGQGTPKREHRTREPIAGMLELLDTWPTPDPVAPPPSLHRKYSKLSRFLFEQRSRVLAKLAQIGPLRPIGPISDLFDLSAETALLAQALGLAEPPDAADRAPDPEALNRQTQLDLAEALEAGQAARETTEQLADRVRAVFNHAASQRLESLARCDSPNVTGNDL